MSTFGAEAFSSNLLKRFSFSVRGAASGLWTPFACCSRFAISNSSFAMCSKCAWMSSNFSLPMVLSAPNLGNSRSGTLCRSSSAVPPLLLRELQDLRRCCLDPSRDWSVNDSDAHTVVDVRIAIKVVGQDPIDIPAALSLCECPWVLLRVLIPEAVGGAQSSTSSSSPRTKAAHISLRAVAPS